MCTLLLRFDFGIEVQCEMTLEELENAAAAGGADESDAEEDEEDVDDDDVTLDGESVFGDGNEHGM